MRVKPALGAVVALLALPPALAHRRAGVVRAGLEGAWPHRAHGAVHVHTGASADGSGDVDRVARAAREAGLDFVVISDHNTDASLGIDSYRQGVLVLGGLEKSTDAGHAVVLGIRDLPFRLDGDPATVVRDAADLGGFVIAAHPTSSHPEGRWTAGLEGVAAVECLNLAEPGAWPHGGGLVWPLLRYLADPQGALLASLKHSREALDFWDHALLARPVAGLLGSDAHGGIRAAGLWIPVPSHREAFRLASQHVLLEEALTGDLARDRGLVFDALRAGHSYAALDALANASGFFFEARSGGRRALMGDGLALEGEAEIRAEADAPRGTTLVLLRDGVEVGRGPRIEATSRESGCYRVEAYLEPSLVPGGRRLPWILSNPIDVHPREELEARVERARQLPAEDPPPPEAVEAVDDFEGSGLAGGWVVDRSTDAAGRLSLDSGALRLDYALGAGPKTHVAAALWRARDLSPYRSLVFRVRADRRMRFDVQVPTGDGTAPLAVRIWRRSVRAETGWRRVAVPLAGLKTYDRGGGRPNLRAGRGIYFHIDEAILAPGSRGTLWIDDVGLAR